VLVLSVPGLAAPERAGGVITTAPAVEVEGVSGSIVVEPAEGEEVEVEWTVTAETSEQLERIAVESREEDGTLAVWVDFAEGDVSLEGHGVDFILRVPRDWDGSLDLRQVSGDILCLHGGGFDLIAECVSGDLEVVDVTGTVDLKTVSGGLYFEGLPRLRRAGVVSGSLEGSIGSLEGDRDVDVECVSGTVDLAMADDLEGRIEVSTMSGDMEISRELEGFDPEEEVAGLSASRGSGRPVLSISSLSGQVLLRAL
jgi:hypothetical protein